MIGDPGVKVEFESTPRDARRAAAAARREIMGPIEALSSRDMFPGVAVIPTMTAGATDGRFLTPARHPDLWRVRHVRRRRDAATRTVSTSASGCSR